MSSRLGGDARGKAGRKEDATSSRSREDEKNDELLTPGANLSNSLDQLWRTERGQTTIKAERKQQEGGQNKFEREEGGFDELTSPDSLRLEMSEERDGLKSLRREMKVISLHERYRRRRNAISPFCEVARRRGKDQDASVLVLPNLRSYLSSSSISPPT